jgi:uncharacterized protein YbaR (Trm112 family)
VHIELTEMLRCPESHEEALLVMSTGEMLGRMVRTGILGCPVCRREYPIVKGVVNFSGGGRRDAGGVVLDESPHPASPIPHPVDPQTLQALLDLSGPGGYVVLVGSAARHAAGLAGLMGGIHFVGVNPPPDAEELPVLSLLRCDTLIPLRAAMARSVVVGSDCAAAPAPWLAEARRVLLRSRRLVIEDEQASAPEGVTRLASGHGLWVGEKQ